MRWRLIVAVGLLISTISSIWIVQNNRAVKKIILSSLISYLEKQWNAQITVEKAKINLFSGIIDLDQLQIQSKNIPQCVWICKKARLHILRQQSLIDSKVTLKIELNKNIIETKYQHSELGLIKLLNSIFKVKSEYFRPKEFEINGINIRTLPHNIAVTIDGSLVIKNDQNDLWHGRLQVSRGNLIKDKNNIIKNLSGTSLFNQTNNNNFPIEMEIKHKLNIPALHPCKSHFLNGTWNSTNKYFCLLQPNETSLSLSPTTNSLLLNGSISILKNTQLEMKITTTPKIGLTGKIVHSEAIPLFGYYHIPAKKLFATIILYNGKLSGTYEATIAHKHTTNTYSTSGIFSIITEVGRSLIQLSGTSQYGNYKALFDWNKKELISLEVGKQIISVRSKKNKLNAKIRYAFLHSLLPVYIQRWLLGTKGNIAIDISHYDQQSVEGTIALTNGKVYVPGFYNMITGLHSKFSINMKRRQLDLHDTVITLQKGKIECNKAAIHWNEQGEISFMHTHVQAKNIMLNWKNDFFAFVDCNMYITSPLKIAGEIVIKKSLLKENVFSPMHTQSNNNNNNNKLNLELDINIFSEEDLIIRTPLLSTQATTNLHLTFKKQPTKLASPQLSGSVNLRKGALHFPKNKLLISSGKIKFVPTQPNNPMIHITARNRIKKYTVTLHLSGPLKNPTIILESNPELTEEQIVALLFAGSERMSLRSDLPAIIMQNLSTLILGNKKYLSRSSKFFKTLTTPLKYIQITPNFTDQTGRGGVKASIAIDINKQLHAYIQKNFSTHDDLAFQIEYFLSDNINIKAIKDHRGDLGAEIEFSFCSFS